ncbi:MAG: GNAT family N-acetyltransferase [Pirellulales bacterium]
MHASPSPVSIEQCPALLRRLALDLLFRDWAPQLRRDQVAYLLETADSGGLDDLLAALNRGRLVGAILGRPLGGRAALVWAPRVVTGAAAKAMPEGNLAPSGDSDEPLRSALLAQLLDRLAASGARLVQALLPLDAAADEALLARGGFARLADLVYMVGFNERAARESSPMPLEFAAYTSASHDRFRRIVERTYEGSLDCPGLNDLRDVDDVLAGYRVTGRFDPRNWLLARADDRDVGCLVLADDPRLDQWELIYMGLVPEVRGRRWGQLLVAQAQRLAAQAGRPRLMLSVDRANEPAVRTYTHQGFVCCDERRVMFRTLAPDGR